MKREEAGAAAAGLPGHGIVLGVAAKVPPAHRWELPTWLRGWVDTAAGAELLPRRCLTLGTEGQGRTRAVAAQRLGGGIAATDVISLSACSSAVTMKHAKLASDGDRFRTYN